MKAIDKYTPSCIDLQNCESLKEALEELDAKYADSVNVSGTLVNDFVNFRTKAAGDESKLVELKAEVMKLYNDLKAVQQDSQLTGNAWLLSQISQTIFTASALSPASHISALKAANSGLSISKFKVCAQLF